MVGMLGTAIGLVLLANSQSIMLLAVAWCVVQFGGNILLSSYGAILPDRVPVAQRGATQAIIGMISPIAIILSDILFTQTQEYRSAYYPVIAVLVILTLFFLFLYRETVLPKENRPAFHLKTFLLSFWINPRKNSRFSMAWMMWLLLWTGYNLGTGGFFFLYVQNITGYENLFPGHGTKDGIAIAQMLQITIGVPLMLAAGILSDRIGRRKIFVMAGALLIGVGLLVLIASSSWPLVLAASVVIGSGFWLYYSLGLAMFTQILPSASDRGKDLGVVNIASTLPQIVMPVVGAAIVNRLGSINPVGYRILFAIGALAIVAAVILLRSIQVGEGENTRPHP